MKKERLFALFLIAIPMMILFNSSGVLAATYSTPGENIYECGTITAPGTYYFNQTIVNQTLATFNCLTISSDNVTIDGIGYELQGYLSNNSFGYVQYLPKVQGIYGASFENIAIKNLTIDGFHFGIRFSTTSNTTIQNDIFRNAAPQGATMGGYTIIP